VEEMQKVQSSSNTKKPVGSVSDRLIDLIGPMIEPMGYEIVHVEVQTHREKTLRIFIDFLEFKEAQADGKGSGIEDCVKVARFLDEPLDQNQEIDSIFHGTYELEVSSPGVDRPLRQAKDFERFKDRQVRIHTFRPLNAEEIQNEAYLAKNPRQKNFLGLLKGFKNDRISLQVGSEVLVKKGKKEKKLAAGELAGLEISIPLTLVSKANLEPVFDFSDTE
jgi:ribosome maturation factor RimP